MEGATLCGGHGSHAEVIGDKILLHGWMHIGSLNNIDIARYNLLTEKSIKISLIGDLLSKHGAEKCMLIYEASNLTALTE